MAAALGVGLIWTALAFVALSRNVSNEQVAQLTQRGTEASTVIESLVAQVESGVTAMSTVVAQSSSVAPLAGQLEGAGMSGLALLRQDAGVARIADRAGTLLSAPVRQGGTLVPEVAAALGRGGLQFAGVHGTGADRTLGVVVPLPSLGSGWALYGEIGLPSSAEIIRAAPGTAFSDLDFAVYLGPRETPAALLLDNTSALPLRGYRAAAAISPSSSEPPAVEVGDAAAPGAAHANPGDLLLVVTARSFLGGALAWMMPWLVAASVLLTAVLVAAVLEVALRRRDEALVHARRLQVALTAVEDAERSFRHLFDDHPNPMWVYDLDTLRFLDVNAAAVARYGYSRDEFLSMSVTAITSAEDGGPVDETAQRSPVIARCGPWRHVLRNGRAIWVEITSHEQEFAGRRAALVLAQDVTERVELEEQLRHQAFHDALTNLPNRALFSDRIEQAVARGRRTGRPSALLLLDLDDFKTINDSLGHAAGDALLVEVAARLRSALRGSDTAARLGGDEFAVLLDEVRDAEAALSKARWLIDQLGLPYDVAGSQMVTSVSIGVCLIDRHTTRSEELLRNADLAMYAAKTAGKCRCELYQHTQHLQVAERHALQHDLVRALPNGELSVVYQPQIDLRRRRVVGVEALVRWDHPERGPIGPDVFIPIAERNGVIHDVDEWVLSTACEQARRWADMGIPPLRIAVNVSGRDLQSDTRLVAAVARTIEETGVRPGDVEIEVTESVAVAQHEQALAILRRLRELRVRVAIDDFGTGYSALSRLKDFSPDRIKIDRTFISGVDADASQQAMVGAMVAMGHSIGLAVLAEGVETVGELEFLLDQGCDEVQGYLVSRPIPAADLERLLHDPDAVGAADYWPDARRLSAVGT